MDENFFRMKYGNMDLMDIYEIHLNLAFWNTKHLKLKWKGICFYIGWEA